MSGERGELGPGAWALVSAVCITFGFTMLHNIGEPVLGDWILPAVIDAIEGADQ